MISGISSSSWQLQSMQAQNASPSDKFADTDINGDNAVDMDEFLEATENDEKSEELFSKIDSDGDGSLTESEMKSFDEEMKENMEMMMSQVMGQMAGMQMGGQPPAGGQPPSGPPPAGGPGGSGSIDGSSILSEMLSATEESEDSSETTDAEELLQEILEQIQEASTANASGDEDAVDSLFEKLQTYL